VRLGGNVVSLFLSKLLPIFVYPLGLAIVLGLFALVRARRIGRVALALALVILWAASTPVSSNWLTAQLEAEYPPAPIETLPHADVAIVLGGSIGQPLPPRVTPDLSDAADRVLYAARLFRAGKADRILVSGGNLPWQAGVKPESQLVSNLLIEFGVRPDAIFQDAESRNTHENAVNSAVIMNAQAWRTALLVTSGAHMPRALATFRRVGLNVIPAATDIRVVYPLYSSLLDFLPDAGALAQTTEAIKEWIGLAVYRVRGWA
jgi:uncharacterized SAM-binding protein YcdF (DUF218 family)